MQGTPMDSSKAGTKGLLPLAGLLLIQLVIGYEWLMSGLAKLVRGNFPGGLAEELHEKSGGAAGWYRSFLDGTVIPHAQAFGYLIEIAELVTGVTLIATGLVWLIAWERLRRAGRVAVLLATGAAAFAGIVMAVNFHLANGDAHPWGIPGDSFEEAVDLDSLIVALQLGLMAVSAGLLLCLRARRPAPSGKGRWAPLAVRVCGFGAGGELSERERRPSPHSGKEMVTVSIQSRKTWPFGRRFLWALASLVVGLAVGAAFLGGAGASASAAPAKEGQIAALEAKVATLEQDARFWQQLTAVLKPAPLHLRSMQDHRLFVLPSGVILGLHFDNMNLAKAKNLNWVVFGVPGRFTKADQQRVERQYGQGFTHFHDLKADTHGGKPGAQGAWFIHIGVRDFQSPFGPVTAGTIDPRFMPTPPKS